MKILVLNGSPKKERSDTICITNSFIEGMNDVCKNDVKVIDVIDKHIEYCKGCFSCKKNGGKCVYDDDMAAILEEILQSDLLIFSFPLYCFGMPAPLKALLDRTMPLSSMQMKKVGDRYEHVGQSDFSRLKYLMISGCGFPSGKNNFEAAIAQFKMCFPNNVTVITVPESPMFNVPEAISVTKPRLKLVRIAGIEYVESGKIGCELSAKISSPMIDEETYAKIANGEL